MAFELLVPARGIQVPDQGLNPGPLHWTHGVLADGPPGSPTRATVLTSAPLTFTETPPPDPIPCRCEVSRRCPNTGPTAHSHLSPAHKWAGCGLRSSPGSDSLTPVNALPKFLSPLSLLRGGPPPQVLASLSPRERSRKGRCLQQAVFLQNPPLPLIRGEQALLR